jgi:hypothetical protein
MNEGLALGLRTEIVPRARYAREWGLRGGGGNGVELKHLFGRTSAERPIKQVG